MPLVPTNKHVRRQTEKQSQIIKKMKHIHKMSFQMTFYLLSFTINLPMRTLIINCLWRVGPFLCSQKSQDIETFQLPQKFSKHKVYINKKKQGFKSQCFLLHSLHSVFLIYGITKCEVQT